MPSPPTAPDGQCRIRWHVSGPPPATYRAGIPICSVLSVSSLYTYWGQRYEKVSETTSLLVCFSANASTFTACRKVRKSERNIKFTLIFLSERSTFTACRKVRKSEQNGYQSGISLNSNQRIVFSSSSSLRSERRMDFAVSSSAVREPVQSASSIAAFSASSSAMADSTAANS